MVNIKITNEGRALFEPFNETDDYDPETKKVGIAVHCALIGFILSLIGKAVKIHDDKTDTDIYFNVASSIRCFNRHKISKLGYYDPEFCFNPFRSRVDIARTVSFASKVASIRNPEAINTTTAQDYLKRGKYNLQVIDFSTMTHEIDYALAKEINLTILLDFEKAVELSQTDKERAQALFGRVNCYDRMAHKGHNEGKKNYLKYAKKGLADCLEIHKLFPSMLSPIDSMISVEFQIKNFKSLLAKSAKP